MLFIYINKIVSDLASLNGQELDSVGPVDNRSSTEHCEPGERLWLQGESALQTHSFWDADPQSVIPQN